MKGRYLSFNHGFQLPTNIPRRGGSQHSSQLTAWMTLFRKCLMISSAERGSFSRLLHFRTKIALFYMSRRTRLTRVVVVSSLVAAGSSLLSWFSLPPQPPLLARLERITLQNISQDEELIAQWSREIFVLYSSSSPVHAHSQPTLNVHSINYES